MAIAYDMMKGGVPAGMAKGINGTTNATVTAGTTQTQNGATALTASNNIVATCASNNDGVRVPSMEIGDSITIYNDTAQVCKVWPPTGEEVNDLGANNGFLLAGRTTVFLKKVTSTKLAAFLSA